MLSQPKKQGGQGEDWDEDFQNISKATISQHSSKLKGEWNQLDFQFSISLLNISQVGILFQAQTSVAAPQSLMIQVCLKD